MPRFALGLFLLALARTSDGLVKRQSQSRLAPSQQQQYQQQWGQQQGLVLSHPPTPGGRLRVWASFGGGDKADAKSSVADEVSYEEDVKRTILWVAASLAFSVGIAATKGTASAIEFCSGYVLEQCLSVDNLFVFLVLFDYFAVKSKAAQERILGYGIGGAIVLRGLFVGLGAVALQQFHQVLLVFALVLGFSSFKILFSGDGEDDEEDLENNAVVAFARRFLKTTPNFDGVNFFTMENGVRVATPLLLCLVCVELSDVVFAFDSVPAVFGVTQDPFIVYTSNIFAIASLRSLFSVLSRAVSDLKYLEKAVGVVLAVIALKLTGETFDVELLSPLQSLALVIGILAGGVWLSLSEKAGEAGSTK